jgi:hypothetical protein
MVYAGLGDKTRAIDSLEDAFAKKDWAVVRSFLGPELASLRTEPRFQALRQKAGLGK